MEVWFFPEYEICDQVITNFLFTGVNVARQQRRLLAQSGFSAEFENP